MGVTVRGAAVGRRGLGRAARWGSVAVVWVVGLVVSVPAFAQSTLYEVGPGQEYEAIGDVMWESLEPGDTVRIHWRDEAYHEKFVIGRRGTEDAPIVVQGVPGPEGQRPVIDGRDATTRDVLNYWNEARGVIKIGGSNVPADSTPSHVVLEGLEVRSGREPFSFTGRDGRTDYHSNAAAVFVEKGEHIVLRDLALHDSGNGLFVASATEDIVIEGCHIYDNGVEQSIYEHNAYTQARGIVYQHNRFGPLREGCLGNNLKDRSAGLVVRYNWIEGGNRQLDLVDGSAYADEPSYRTTYVYGNILLERGDGNRQVVHYGGDGSDTDGYRKGTLFFYHNTVVSRRPGRTTLMRLSTEDEQADVRNNIVLTTRDEASPEVLSDAGRVSMRNNLLDADWTVSFGAFDGRLEGQDENIECEDGEAVFVNPEGHEYRPAAGSQAVEAAGRLHPDVPDEHAVTRQWGGVGAWAERKATRDIGALAAEVEAAGGDER